MNRSDYVAEGFRQLSDRKFYEPTQTNLTSEHNTEVKAALDAMLTGGEIDMSVYTYLYIKEPKTPSFYLLPKIHKGKIPPPGRPIVSANNCPTERISGFVDFFLRPSVALIPSYIKDTTHFLQIINSLGTLPPGCLLVTMDVTSLYTNIPNTEGITAVSDILTRDRTGALYPTNQSLIRLLKLVLEKNNFEFNGSHYIQVGGTAMGTRVAPSLANLFMADFENRYIYTYHLQPTLYKRYIDDCIMIWQHGRTELDRFLDHLNACHDSIKFTAEISDKEVPFLDTKLILTDDNLTTDLYTKPTDAHIYLHYTSAHPQHMKTGLPYSQFLRICRICSHIEDFDRNALHLATHFKARGYPTDLISDSFIRARRQDRNSLLNPARTESNKVPESPFYMITTFQPGFSQPQEIVKTNWDILSSSKVTRDLHDTPIIFGYRRNRNLKDHLVKAKLPQETETSANIRQLKRIK